MTKKSRSNFERRLEMASFRARSAAERFLLPGNTRKKKKGKMKGAERVKIEFSSRRAKNMASNLTVARRSPGRPMQGVKEIRP